MFTVDSSLLLRCGLSPVASALLSVRGFVMTLALCGFVLCGSGVSMADEAVADSAAEVDHDHDHAGEDSHGDDLHGGDHSGHGDEAAVPPLLQFDFGSAICNLAIFLGVFAILSKFVWPVILDGLKAREQKIHGDLVAAEKANADAKALLDDYQSQLAEASTKVQTMLADARKDAETNGQKIVEEAKAEAQRQTERAVADIETAKKVALADLAGQTSDMAMAVAGQVVGRELQAGDHAELIRQSLQRLPSDN
ncbi:ATP synthase subunit b [Rubripirellula obstinata]|uniref:ATP synthase subunit b n=1 Tax=Rubripirellula obstinata TaxID=406547 RepID=A0A5B1CH78_9BACT|nr:F0F1 ATP synthase subunit B [Rubripirellula obstinata]KAA1259571.1 ATP synthase subunit b [Rubripirellula obstinata]